MRLKPLLRVSVASITLRIHPTSSFRAMTLSQSDSPNCVVRSLDNQLAGLSSMSSSKDSASAGAGSEEAVSPYQHSPMKSDTQATLQAPMKDIRNLIFQLCALTGSLSTLFWQKMPLDQHHEPNNSSTTAPEEAVTVMVQLLQQLMELSTALSIDLGKACLTKIELNNRKYPVELCKVSVGEQPVDKDPIIYSETVDD